MAGKLGLAYVAPVATKAALIAATHSLRAEHMRGPAGFSVICPGFVSADGMYQRTLDEGFSSNRLVGSTTIEKVADKVIDAIRRDRPEVIESGGPVRPLLALAQVAPGGGRAALAAYRPDRAVQARSHLAWSRGLSRPASDASAGCLCAGRHPRASPHGTSTRLPFRCGSDHPRWVDRIAKREFCGCCRDKPWIVSKGPELPGVTRCDPVALGGLRVIGLPAL
jgi:hypothetical protein